MSKSTAKKTAAPKAKPNRTTPAGRQTGESGARRIDGAGHMDPEHAARLRGLGRELRDEDPVAFVQDPTTADDLAEELGEETVAAMTTGQPQIAEERDEPVDEEAGGPFIETSGNTEFAGGTDGTNVPDATREPFPKT